jgi:glutaredoxin
MKKLKYLLVLFVALLLPIAVFAEGEETTSTESKEVKIYFFRGEGCPHCEEAEEWFKSIEEEYGDYFQIVDYETWYNQENAELMQRVAKARGEEAQGVPYIIIGNKSWNGFTESYEEEMISEIQSEFDKKVDDRYDIMKLLPNGVKKEKEKSSNDVLALILILVVVGGVCFGVYKARNNTN